jgi:hypothetical protein
MGMRRCLSAGWLGYLVPVVFTLTALTVAAAHGEEPGTQIWLTEQGVYTDMPDRYPGGEKLWKPSRDRWTRVLHKPVRLRHQHERLPTDWGAVAAVRVVPGGERCAGVFLGNRLVHGGAAVCRGERVIIRRERVRERRSITTTTDTVLLIGGREVMRIEGPRYNHRPRTVRRQ